MGIFSVRSLESATVESELLSEVTLHLQRKNNFLINNNTERIEKITSKLQQKIIPVSIHMNANNKNRKSRNTLDLKFLVGLCGKNSKSESNSS